jgi:hypothetical protein
MKISQRGEMRVLYFLIVFIAAVIPASAIANQCVLSDESAVAPSAAATCQPSSIGLQASASGVRYAQYAPYRPGGCFRGQRACINGWINICQCYSYGCNFMATGTRCRR